MDSNNKKINNKSIGLIYALGIIFWLIWWNAISWDKGFRDKYFFSKWFFIPLIIGLVILIINCLLWRKKGNYDYNREEELKAMASVEMNTSYLILAITIAMMVQQVFIEKDNSRSFIINFQLWALVFAVLPLALIWVPSTKPNFLIRLRHVKTVLFTCAMSFFIAGIIGFWQGYLLKG